MLAALRALTTLALDDNTIAVDPTAGVRRPKLSKQGIEAWSENEIAAYEAHHPIGSLQPTQRPATGSIEPVSSSQ
jgi:hypothetical protein